MKRRHWYGFSATPSRTSCLRLRCLPLFDRARGDVSVAKLRMVIRVP